MNEITKERLVWAGSIAVAIAAGYYAGIRKSSENSEEHKPPARNGDTIYPAARMNPGPPGPDPPGGLGAAAPAQIGGDIRLDVQNDQRTLNKLRERYR